MLRTQGVLGEVLPLPEGLAGSSGAQLLGGSMALLALGESGLEALALVRWTLPLAEGTGQWVLLCRAFEAVAAVQQVSWPAAAATVLDRIFITFSFARKGNCSGLASPLFFHKASVKVAALALALRHPALATLCSRSLSTPLTCARC